MSRGLEEVFTVLTRFVNSCSEIREKLSRIVWREGKGVGAGGGWGTFACMSFILPTTKGRKLLQLSTEEIGTAGDVAETMYLIVSNKILELHRLLHMRLEKYVALASFTMLLKSYFKY